MKGKYEWKKTGEKSNFVELLKMIKKIAFTIDTGKNIYMTTWRVKQESDNLFQKNKTPEIYLEEFLCNTQVEKLKECGIWLDDRTIMLELKISKGSNITWNTTTSSDIKKSREFTMEKIQAIVFIQH